MSPNKQTIEARRCADRLPQSTCPKLAQGLKDGDVPDALRSAVRQANDAVWAAATGPDRKGMGATLVAAVVDGPRVFFTVVGDSRAYVMRSALQQFID